MNGRKAKLLRRAGVADKKGKRMYNSLTPRERHQLELVLKEMIKNGVQYEQGEQPKTDTESETV